MILILADFHCSYLNLAKFTLRTSRPSITFPKMLPRKKMAGRRYVRMDSFEGGWRSVESLYYFVSGKVMFAHMFVYTEGLFFFQVCSKSLVFDPRDTRAPIIKFPLRSFESVQESQGEAKSELLTRWATWNSIVVFVKIVLYQYVCWWTTVIERPLMIYNHFCFLMIWYINYNRV